MVDHDDVNPNFDFREPKPEEPMSYAYRTEIVKLQKRVAELEELFVTQVAINEETLHLLQRIDSNTKQF